MNSYIIGAIFGAVLVGSIIGSIPTIYGFEKGTKGLAIGGFFACLVAHFILGLVLSVPVCLVFLFLIHKSAKNKDKDTECTTNVDIK